MEMPRPKAATMPAPSMPAPKPVTFGDRRPAKPKKVRIPAPKTIRDHRRRPIDGAKPVPEIQRYQQTNGPMFLARMKYNGVWLTTTGLDEADAIDRITQFYYSDTAQGQSDSEEVKS